MKKTIYQTFGWHFMCKEVSDFTNTSYFEIMQTPAMEVSGIVALIHYKSIYNQFK